MTSLSRRRKEMSTAFLIHWFTAHWPSIFSATRRRPWSRPSMTSATASRTMPDAEEGERVVRTSKASSMIFCRSCMGSLDLEFLTEVLAKADDAAGGLQALGRLRHQGDANEAGAGIALLRFPGEEAAGQDRHIIFTEQAAGEGVRDLVNYAITPSITDLWQVSALQQAAEQPFAVHLKLDLGMGRIDILEREL